MTVWASLYDFLNALSSMGQPLAGRKRKVTEQRIERPCLNDRQRDIRSVSQIKPIQFGMSVSRHEGQLKCELTRPSTALWSSMLVICADRPLLYSDSILPHFVELHQFAVVAILKADSCALVSFLSSARASLKTYGEISSGALKPISGHACTRLPEVRLALET